MKSASDIYAPMSGQVFEVNEDLTSKPSLINKSAEGEGIPKSFDFLTILQAGYVKLPSLIERRN